MAMSLNFQTFLILAVSISAVVAAGSDKTCQNIQNVKLMAPAKSPLTKAQISKLGPLVQSAIGGLSPTPWHTVDRVVIQNSCGLEKDVVTGSSPKQYLPFVSSNTYRIATVLGKNNACAAAASGDKPQLELVARVWDDPSAEYVLAICPAKSKTCRLDILLTPLKKPSNVTTKAVAARRQQPNGTPEGRDTANNCDERCGAKTDIDEMMECYAKCCLYDPVGYTYYYEGSMDYPPIITYIEGTYGFGKYCSQKEKIPKPQSSCFPADAVVITENSGEKQMNQLVLGDKVLSTRDDGSVFFDTVYMFGHKDNSVKAHFIALQTSHGKTLRLTPDHFVSVVKNGQEELISAADAQIGDLLRVVVTDKVHTTEVSPIVAKSIVQGKGLWNPYTLEGKIVVDGVAASVHSSWVLDSIFSSIGVSVPTGYQFVFTPIRALFNVLGVKASSPLEAIIDGVATATHTSGTLSMFPALTFVAATAALVSFMQALSRKLSH